MQEKIGKVCATVLKEVTPDNNERARIEALAKKLEKKIVSASKELGVEVDVRVEGSVAKDTWLSEEPDIDIFMRVPTTIPRKSLGDVCLEIARKATEGSKQIERFAEHPYLEAMVDATRVNIVPCYKVKRGEWLSATDRTPFHTDYVKKQLDEQMKGEVRLLKKYMKGTSVYGAEIKVGGFSGYLCELLILQYKSFLNTLKAFAQHKKRIIIDIKGYYEGRENELGLLFKDPLIIVDPVDKGRNVASAVQPQKLYTFIAAARAFLKNPNLKFFCPPETVASPSEELKQKLEKRGTAIIFLTFEKVDAVPDILWGQLYKSQRSLHKLIQLSGFKVLRDLPYSEEENINMFIFKLEQRFISQVKYIEDGRWVVELRRKYTDAVVLLKEKLKDGGRNAGVAEKISKILRKEFKVFVNDEIMDVYKKNTEFAKFLTEFLLGKPKWLENEV